jgi:hypothetical protein
MVGYIPIFYFLKNQEGSGMTFNSILAGISLGNSY